MKTLTTEEVKNYLKKNKHYDFSTDFWDDEVMVVLYECIEACNHLHASQFRGEISEEEIPRMADKYADQKGKLLLHRTFNRSDCQEDFIKGAKAMLPYTREKEWISVEETEGLHIGQEVYAYTPKTEITEESYRIIKYGSISNGFPAGVTHYQIPAPPVNKNV